MRGACGTSRFDKMRISDLLISQILDFGLCAKSESRSEGFALISYVIVVRLEGQREPRFPVYIRNCRNEKLAGAAGAVCILRTD